jgi:hypothetical protein
VLATAALHLQQSVGQQVIDTCGKQGGRHENEDRTSRGPKKGPAGAGPEVEAGCS